MKKINHIILGTDLVSHSATKLLGGHKDALGRVICGPKDLIADLDQALTPD